MLQLDLKTFFKTPFRDDLFFLPTFFLSFHAPSEFISLFFTAHNKKEGGIEKSFGRQKMLGTAKPSGVIFSVQRAKTGTLSYPSTEINLPFKNKGSQTGL